MGLYLTKMSSSLLAVLVSEAPDRGRIAGGFLLENAEADAWEEVQRHVAPAFRERFGISVRRIGGAVAITAPLTEMLAVNRVWLPGHRATVQVAVLDEVIAHFQTAGAKHLMAHCPPWGLTDGSSDLFASRGFRTIHSMSKLCRLASTDAVHASPFQVVTIGREDADLFGRIAALGNSRTTRCRGSRLRTRDPGGQ